MSETKLFVQKRNRILRIKDTQKAYYMANGWNLVAEDGKVLEYANSSEKEQLIAMKEENAKLKEENAKLKEENAKLFSMLPAAKKKELEVVETDVEQENLASAT